MLCTRITPIVISNSGQVVSCFDLSDGQVINVPYYEENITLLFKDITSTTDCIPIARSSCQKCPSCGHTLHIRRTGNFCYNIHCNSIRMEIFYQHLRLLNIFFSDRIALNATSTILEGLNTDTEYNILRFIVHYLQADNLSLNYKAVVRSMPLVTYLRILRLTDIDEDTLYILQRQYYDIATFLQSVLSGEFISLVGPGIDPEFKDAVQISVSHTNRRFAEETLRLIQDQ